MIVGEDGGGRGANLLWCLELACDNAPLELLELDPHTFHSFKAPCPFVCHSVIGVNHKHPDTRFVGSNLLNQRLRRHRLLAGGDTGRTLDPGSGGTLNIVENFPAAPAIAADNVAMAAHTQRIKILAGDHPAIADQDDSLDAEPALKIMHHVRHGLGIALVALEDMVGNRPAIDHNQSDQHLRIARLLITTMAERADPLWSPAFKVCRCEVVKYHIDLQRKQIPQLKKQCPLDLCLALQQLIEGAIPLLELALFDLHPRRPARFACGVVTPLRNPSAAVTVAHKIGLQPTREPMLAAR